MGAGDGNYSQGRRERRFAGRLVVFWLVAACACCGQVLAGQEAPPLFSSQQPLVLTLVGDFKSLLVRKYWSKDRWYDGRIELQDEAGRPRSLPVKLKPRGGFRTRDDTCYFPQLFVDFSAGDTRGTPFEGQKILPLTTHCRGSSTYSAYIYREYMAYRLYGLLAEKSLRARAALITYVRDDKSNVVAKRYAFFVEHFDDLAARMNAKVVELDVFHPLSGDAFEMGVLSMFQFMVGNTDWSAAFQHNIFLLQQPDKPITAVPFDFDFSGLVNAKYAAPGKQFSIRSVRTRVYRGYCRDYRDTQEVIDYFQEKKPEVFSLLRGHDWIPESVQDDSVRYIGSFYELLDSPAKIEKQVNEQCGRGRPVRAD